MTFKKKYVAIPVWKFCPSSNYVFIFRMQYEAIILGGHFVKGNSIRAKIAVHHARLCKLFYKHLAVLVDRNLRSNDFTR